MHNDILLLPALRKRLVLLCILLYTLDAINIAFFNSKSINFHNEYKFILDKALCWTKMVKHLVV